LNGSAGKEEGFMLLKSFSLASEAAKLCQWQLAKVTPLPARKDPRASLAGQNELKKQ
jgi:hypothetical protein